MTSDEWSDLTPGFNGERLDPRDIIGHLLIIWVVEYLPHKPTQFSQANKLSDVIVVDAVDLDQADSRGYQGKLCQRVWWRQSRLISTLRNDIGRRKLCRMTKGTANSGFNAPFELISMISDQECMSRANAWIRAHPDFVPSAPLETETAAGTMNPNSNAVPAAAAPLAMSMLERMAEQAQRGADRLPPPPPPAEDQPPW